MCIAILNEIDLLDKFILKNCWDNNPQGAGLLYNYNELTRFVSYDFKEFYKEYVRVRNLINTPIVLHFRIATSGFDKNGKNLHPFLINKNLGFVHNGVINGLGNNYESDTFQFNELLKTLPDGFENNYFIMDLLTNYIYDDKIIFLDSSNNYTILNEYLGIWHNNNWYSNNSFNEINYKYYGNKKIFNDFKD